MRLTPVLTEKSLHDAKEGKYTFLVDKGLTKGEISRLVESSFAVSVTSVRTANIKGGERKNFRGRIQTKKAYKKAWVGLKDKEKIELFEEKTK
jgi:ribosomal protein L23